ncbi:MAG TPA: winged helix-turn-helix domain-containing protein [Thermoanaerobaculia bacterium]|nr:winged helix-turn-helix domain-containing protein [Thermoanaerobaculia bacterium]
MSEGRRRFEFAGYRIDEERRLLLRDGEPVPLTSRVFDTLLALVKNSGRLLSKEELMREVWGSAHVEEGNLTVNISVLRKALEEKPDQHRFIVTVPGRGYRFIAEVMEESAEPEEKQPMPPADVPSPDLLPPALPATPAASAPANRRSLPGGKSLAAAAVIAVTAVAYVAALAQRRSPTTDPSTGVRGPNRRSIAVLPFSPLDGHDEDRFLGLGMADAIITKLSGLRPLLVRPTSAVTKYAGSSLSSLEAGREQRVDTVLEGSIQRADGRVRVSARLLEVSDGAALWAFQDEIPAGDALFPLQDALSEKIADALTVRLTDLERRSIRKHYTESPAAFEDYVEGRYWWNQRTPDGLRKAIALFQKAVADDPGYALAWAGLADCYSLAVWYVPMPASEAVPKLTEAATRAVALDPGLAEAHLGMGNVRSFGWDWKGARRELERAIELNPGYATARHWHALHLALIGEFDEAIREAQRARELDPLSPSINADLGWVYYLARRDPEAIAAYRSTLSMEPRFSLAHFDLALALSDEGNYAEAIAEMEKASDRGSDYLAGLGYVYGRAGLRPEALRALSRLKALSRTAYVPPYHFAWIYTGLGDRDRAIGELEQVYREHTQHVVDFKVAPMFDPLRGDPRYQDLVRRVGL